MHQSFTEWILTNFLLKFLILKVSFIDYHFEWNLSIINEFLSQYPKTSCGYFLSWAYCGNVYMLVNNPSENQRSKLNVLQMKNFYDIILTYFHKLRRFSSLLKLVWCHCRCQDKVWIILKWQVCSLATLQKYSKNLKDK